MSTALAFPLAGLRFGPVPLIKYFIDELLVNKKQSMLYFFPLAVIGLYVLNFAIRFAHYYIIRVVIIRVNQTLKSRLYKHILNLSADHFTDKSTGTLMSRIANDVNYIDGGIAAINMGIREPLTFIFLFGYAFYLNWKLTLITLLMFPFLAWIFSYSGKKLKKYMTRMTEENARIFSSLQESFTGIRVIKTFQLEDENEKKFDKKVADFSNFHLKTAAVEEAAHPMVELLTAFAIAAVAFYGGSLIISNQMTSGDLIAFFIAFGLMMHPIRLMNDVNMKLNQASAATDRIFEIFSWKSTIIEKENALAVSTLESKIKFNNIEFHYPDAPEKPILKKISFTIPKNKTIAIVGESGAGKSSLVNLLPRLFDVQAGEILWDGKNIKDFKINDLRSLISIVNQDVFLFNDTIMENIKCGKTSAPHEDILRASMQAHATEFIENTPNGFNTIIGDRGQKLSGGQRQRLAIARAFLRNSPVLILDEATSSLDNASEKIVQEALKNLMENKTTLVIAHRLSTIKNADEIIVLKNGLIVERGTHHSLIAQAGEYSLLYKMGEFSEQGLTPSA